MPDPKDPKVQPTETHTVTLSTGRHKFVILPGGDVPSHAVMQEKADTIHRAILRGQGPATRNVKAT
jgi:hypothetical protein